jgi:hypothetical protein
MRARTRIGNGTELHHGSWRCLVLVLSLQARLLEQNHSRLYHKNETDSPQARWFEVSEDITAALLIGRTHVGAPLSLRDDLSNEFSCGFGIIPAL